LKLTLTLTAERLVRAPREVVWRVFAEATDWPSWGPGGPGVEMGAALAVRPLGWPVRARAWVEQARAGEEVSWRARWWGLTSRHGYSFADAPGGTLVRAREEITGWAILPLRPFFSPRRLSGASGRWLTELARKAEALAGRG
jgi:hypothetical protein